MSLKSIEMQIALPRTIDAAKLQDQLSQKGQLINDQANLQMQQEEIKQRMTVVKQEQKDQAKFQQQGGNSGGNSDYKEKREGKVNQKSKEKHPYKGNFLDYSG